MLLIMPSETGQLAPFIHVQNFAPQLNDGGKLPSGDGEGGREAT